MIPLDGALSDSMENQKHLMVLNIFISVHVFGPFITHIHKIVKSIY